MKKNSSAPTSWHPGFVISRRGFLKGSVAAGSLTAASPLMAGRSNRVNETGDCGVASGDPRPNSVVIWTRVPDAYQPSDGGSIAVAWEVSTTEEFDAADVIASGTAATSSEEDYTLSVRVESLEPFTHYYYRFSTASGYSSVMGRTLTAPAESDDPSEIRFAFVSCQHYVQGFYNALDTMATEDVHFCACVGDFIYETGGSGVRNDYVGEIQPGLALTLNDFRDKYKLYMSDAALREVRRLFPWIFIWDDHEVRNNFAGGSEENTESDRELQRNGYQAFREFMPMDPDIVLTDNGGTPELVIHRSFRFGKLMDLFALDERQWREGEVCPREYGMGCEEMYDDERTMLGHDQADWLKAGLAASDRQWKFVLNQVVMMPIKLTRGILPVVGGTEWQQDSEGLFINSDQWDGYPKERHAILSTIEENSVSNVVFCTGDIHNCYAGLLRTDFSKAHTPAVAVEVVGGSVSSDGIAEYVGGRDLSDLLSTVLRPPNPHILYVDAYYHVYTRVVVSKSEMVATYVAVDTVIDQNYNAFELARVTVPDGKSEMTIEESSHKY